MTEMTTQEYLRSEPNRRIQHDIEGRKLHLGCGYLKLKGFINIDVVKEVQPDLVVDMEDGLPFPDNTFTHIYSYHVLEHIRPDKWKFVLEEIYRVSAPKCVIELNLPTANAKNWGDVDHYRTFWFHSFHHNEYEVGRNYYMKFIVRRLDEKPHYLWRALCSLFPSLISDVYFRFEVIK